MRELYNFYIDLQIHRIRRLQELGFQYVLRQILIIRFNKLIPRQPEHMNHRINSDQTFAIEQNRRNCLKYCNEINDKGNLLCNPIIFSLYKV